MGYNRKKRITFEAVLKDRSLKGVTDIGRAFKRITKPIDQINNKLKRTLAAISPITHRLNSLSKAFHNTGIKIGKTVGLAGAAVGGYSLFESANFEDELNKVEAVTKATKKQKEELSKIAESLNKDTQFTGKQALQGMKYLSMANFKVPEIKDMIKPTVHLTGAAQLNSEIDLKQTSDIFSNIMSAFELDSSKAKNTADKLAYAFSNSNTTLEELGMALRNLAPLAKTAGVSFEESIALLMQVSGSGIKGEMAGTAFAGAFSRLLNLTPESRKILKDRGVTEEEEKEYLSKDGKIKNFLKFLATLEAHRIKPGEVMKILGQESGKYLVGLVKKHSKIADTITKLEDESNNEAKRLNQVNLRGFWGKLKLLMSSISAFAKKIGDLLLLDWGTSLVESATKIMKSLNEMNPKYIKLIGTVTAVTAALAGLLVTLGVIASLGALAASGLALLKGGIIGGAGSALLGSASAVVGLGSAGTLALGTGAVLGSLEIFDMLFGTSIGPLGNLKNWFVKSLGLNNKKLKGETRLATPEEFKIYSSNSVGPNLDQIKRYSINQNNPLVANQKFIDSFKNKEQKLVIDFKNTPKHLIVKQTKGSNIIVNLDRGTSMEGAQ